MEAPAIPQKKFLTGIVTLFDNNSIALCVDMCCSKLLIISIVAKTA